jgi:DNA invertase Pin-like site-specific DNA recombinase
MKRVAVYARVSTDDDDHKNNPKWEFVYGRVDS